MKNDLNVFTQNILQTTIHFLKMSCNLFSIITCHTSQISSIANSFVIREKQVA